MKLNPLGDLFALPLQSAIKAQSLALQETMAVIETMGMEDGKAKLFRLKAERMVEERKIDPATGQPETKFIVQPFELSIPLLALLPISPMQLQEMNVDFGVEVVETKTEPIKATTIPSAMLGSSLSGSLSLFTALGQSNPATMKVHMRIVKEAPEGIARMGDLLTDLLSGKAEKGPTVNEIPGMPENIARILMNSGIVTVAKFLVATEKAAARAELAKTLGVSARKMTTWRKDARQLAEKESPV